MGDRALILVTNDDGIDSPGLRAAVAAVAGLGEVGKTGFIGIRLKFGSKYLFTEYHWDQGPPYGTVQPKEDLGLIPDDIDIYKYK